MENDLLTSDIKGQRTLATVVFTDCVGFSARMSVNEDHTLDLIRRDLQFMKQVCGRFEGRVLKSTGDGLLMCFISAVKAVECAIEIQKTLTERAATLPAEDALVHRIGIHLADMFISNTDVMGNGVNIAARLQTEADPGGICISQTVYDVIKAGLHLETVYLGPRELKNIREVVPAYKILLSPEDKSADSASIVVRNLGQNPNLLRIQKLLLYVCRNAWESDQNRLKSLNLNDLIQELLTLAPTPERIKVCLDTAVKTLSKPAEYSLVADIILKEVSRLCANEQPLTPSEPSDSQTIVEAKRPTLTELGLPYEQIALELEQSGNLLRIKKLAFYVCRKRWENDTERLDQIRLADLIAELHRVAPTLERLQLMIHGFVQTLSKQAEYSLIANAIVSKLQPLYIASGTISSVANHAVAPSETQAINTLVVQPVEQSPYQQIAQQLEHEPDVLRIKKLMFCVCRRQWESNAFKLEALDLDELIQELHQLVPTSEQLEAALDAVVKMLSKQAEYSAIAQIIIRQLSRLYSNNQKSDHQKQDQPEVSPLERADSPLPAPGVHADTDPQNSQSPSSPDLFEYRLGIMKYANPLRTKILLFSALHYDFSFSSQQDWLNLKMHELDGLLRHLLNACRSYTDMEALLYAAARRLREPEENIQTADTVIKCLRSFYLHGGAVVALSHPSAKTEINLDYFEETTLEFARFVEDDDYTCGLLPSTSDSPSTSALIETSEQEPTQLEQTNLLSANRQVDSNTIQNGPVNLYPPST